MSSNANIFIHHVEFGIVEEANSRDPNVERVEMFPIQEIVIGTTMIEVTRDLWQFPLIQVDPLRCFTVTIHILEEQPWISVGDTMQFTNLPREFHLFGSQAEVSKFVAEQSERALGSLEKWTTDLPV